MTRLRPSAFLGLVLALGFGAPGAAQNATELLGSAWLFGSAPCLVLRLELSIEEQGGTRKREVELSLDRRGGRSLSFSRVTSPAFLSDMKFLKRIEPGKPEAQWVKTSKGLRRFGEGNGGEAVFGSHFTVEDFGAVMGGGFELSLAPELDTGAELAVLARPLRAATYADRVIYIARADGLIMRMDYRDAAGKALRRYRVLDIAGTGAARHPAAAVMEDLARGGSTAVKVLAFETPATLPERLFNPGGL